MSANTIAEIVAKMLVDRLRVARPWADLTEEEQQQAINDSLSDARVITRYCLQAAAASGPVARAPITFDWFKLDKRIDGKFTMDPTADNVASLMAFKGKQAIVVFVDPKEHALIREEEEPQPDRKQPDLPLEDKPAVDPAVSERSARAAAAIALHRGDQPTAGTAPRSTQTNGRVAEVVAGPGSQPLPETQPFPTFPGVSGVGAAGVKAEVQLNRRMSEEEPGQYDPEEQE